MMWKLKGRYKKGTMMLKLKWWIDKSGHYVEMKGWMQNGL